MMDGEVVAWRVNRDYAAIECYQERPLRQSGTFVLVKSVYKPDEQANKHDHPRTLTQGDTLAVLQQRSFLLNSGRSRLLWCNVFRTVNPPENFSGSRCARISGT